MTGGEPDVTSTGRARGRLVLYSAAFSRAAHNLREISGRFLAARSAGTRGGADACGPRRGEG